MIVRTAVFAVVLLVAAVLETSLFPIVTRFTLRPDLLLLVTVAVALRDGPLAGLRVGFAAGLVSDLMVSQAPAGLSVLVMVVIGYAVGVARPYIAPDSWSAPILLAFVSGLVGTAATATLALLLGDERVALVVVAQVALAVAVTNTLLAPVALGIVGRLTDRFPLRGAALAD